MVYRTGFIVLAAGSGTRFEGSSNKVYAEIRDIPVLRYSIEAALAAESVETIVVVVHSGELAVAEALAPDTRIVTGGKTRQQSELAGLESIAAHIEGGDLDVVAIHDGARPFVTAPLIDDLARAAGETGGAMPGLEPTDAIWTTDQPPTPLEKSSLRTVQTPQAFRAAPLLAAYRTAAGTGFEGADTAATVGAFSDLAVTIVEGDRRNLKITFADDLDRATLLAPKWSPSGWLS